MTKHQRRALEWLKEHNRTGVFDKHGVLLAAGELAPFRRQTWNALRDLGALVFQRNGRKVVRVTVDAAA